MELRRLIFDANAVFEYLKAEDRVRNIREGFANSAHSTLTNQAGGVLNFLRELELQQNVLLRVESNGETEPA